MTRISGWIVFVALALSVWGCGGAVDDERAAEIANATQQVASALRGAARYGGAPADADGAALLDIVRGMNPKLFAPFGNVTLKVRHDGGYTSVLVCDAAGARGLVEDTGCTQETDARLWEQEAPCAFTLDLAAVCAR